MSIALASAARGTGSGKRRERDRRARERRVAKLEVMRKTLDALEYATLVISTLGDVDAVWDDFLDEKTMRVRQALRLIQETRTLALDRTLLSRLFEEHQLASRMLQELLSPPSFDGWDLKVKQLREAEHTYFKPWTRDECQDEIDAALKEINAFMWSQDKVTTGVSFLGWHELRRVDPVRGQFQFQFSKTFKGYDIMDYVNVGWDTYTDAKTFREVILANRLQCSYEVLQQVGPNTVVVHGAQRFPPDPVEVFVVHACYLIFRIRTERGFLLCVRSIICPGLQKALDGPNDTWASNFLWFHWEELGGGEYGYSVRSGGTVGSKEVNYLNRWMFEALGCLLRSERLATGRGLITSE